MSRDSFGAGDAPFHHMYCNVGLHPDVVSCWREPLAAIGVLQQADRGTDLVDHSRCRQHRALFP